MPMVRNGFKCIQLHSKLKEWSDMLVTPDFYPLRIDSSCLIFPVPDSRDSEDANVLQKRPPCLSFYDPADPGFENQFRQTRIPETKM